ncbi:hypothetical protein J3459_016458 [Metarhizium acridum]|uniref:Uncharacterized protein n=1 Tax=Metarhizium acridum (strain CQMa 102) TaxID=655827 RepID=E9EI10_METAQ|nr:uncharacterized protein MAC_09508 [Metarhizium acridum CQMa 102]EFY84451.1 hypothetical protein MAC_09508 [Metarhizium acridum CQMa 102]KAG8407041.1 hypothetical protein J3458_020538 [Metarhizium acridum]KAG8411245.1 hypothetical protein J3459_016458 [Metarhizium acridum]
MGLRPAQAARLPRLFVTKAYHTTPISHSPYKDSQDRKSLNPRSAEATKSGRDDDVAGAPKAAFGRGITSPEGERATATKEEGGDPLEASGANQDLSKPQGDERSGHATGAGKEIGKGGKSGGGSAPKNAGTSKRY